jgi:hypothetical protein
MNNQTAIGLLADVEVKKVEVILSLSGIEKNTPLIECLWPRVTFICRGKEKVHPFTYWREMMDMKKGDPNFKHHTFSDVVFLAATLRPVARPIVIADAAEAKAKALYKKVQTRITQATQKKSFQERHRRLMRKIERATGKKALRDLLLSLPLRLEKRDVIEAWNEAIVYNVMES